MTDQDIEMNGASKADHYIETKTEKYFAEYVAEKEPELESQPETEINQKSIAESDTETGVQD